MKQIIFVFILLSSLLLSAQVPLPKIIEIGESQGLYLNDQIANVKVDREGIIWIVTFSEIIKYDGTSFTDINTNTADHSSFMRFDETFDGRKYVGDFDGGVFFIEGDSIKPYKFNQKIINTGSKRAAMYAEFLKNGNAFFTPIARGLFKIDKNGKATKLKLNINNIYLSFTEDGKPISFQQADFSDVYKKSGYETKSIVVKDDKMITMDSIEYQGVASAYFKSKASSLDNRMFFTYNFKDIFEIDANRKLRIHKFEHHVLNFFIDSSNKLWVSTKNNGVYVYENCNLDDPPHEILFPNESRIVSSEDKDGDIWGYSELRGLFKIEDPNFIYYSQINDNTSFPSLNAIELVSNKIYIALPRNNLGVLNMDNHKVTTLKMPELNTEIDALIDVSNPTLDLKFDTKNKRLWIAQGNYIRYLEGGDFFEFKGDGFRYPNGFYNSFYQNSKDTAFSLVGTHSNCFFKIKGTKLDYVSENHVGNRLYDVLFVQDTAYANSKNGIFVYKSDQFEKLESNFEAVNKRIFDWVYFNKKIWISTKSAGIFSYSNLTFKEEVRTEVELSSGRFLQENDSVLWVFSKQASIEIVSSKEGELINWFRPIPNEVYNDIKIVDSIVYAATVKSGIMTFNINTIRSSPLKAPSFWISEIKIMGKQFHKDSLKADLPFDNNDIDFKYKSPSYKGYQINYRYKLSGLSNNWIYTNESEVEFSDLKSGIYSFEIQARKEPQIWSESKIFEFEILPPFWKTWWFLSSLIILMCFMGLYLIRRQVKQKEREKLIEISRLKSEQRALRAKMDPHFMFNVLASLQYLVSNNLNEKASQFLEQFSSLMRTTLDQTSSEFVALKDEINFLTEYMEMERLRLEGKFDFKITLDENCKEGLLIPNFLIQPFIENSIHHGIKLKEGKGLIQLHFKCEGDFVKVEIKDDGIGLATTLAAKKEIKSKRKSYGVETVQKRLKLRNGKESVNLIDLSELDANKTGTKATILIKLEKK